jgi:hypothetical protein
MTALFPHPGTDCLRTSIKQNWSLAIANPLDYLASMVTVAEVPEYIRLAETAEKRQDIVSYLAAHPKSGDLIEGAGGIRKIRRGRNGRGKSGGVRVIYYYHGEVMPTLSVGDVCQK